MRNLVSKYQKTKNYECSSPPYFSSHLAGWGCIISFLSISYFKNSGSVYLAYFLVFPFLFYAVSAFSFSRQKGISFFRSLLYGIEAFFHYPKFQWVRKPQLPLTDEEKIQLLKESPKITRVTWPSSFLCPFCRIEIPEILKTIPNEGIAVKSRPLYCPKCHTRLDVCRYCIFFEPAASSFLGGGVDISTGKCTVIKKNQPIEEICEPSVAKTRARNVIGHFICLC